MANETLPTLKNPGDHFEPNDGRGTKHLSERGNTGPQVVDALLLISCYCYPAIVIHIHRREGESHGHSMDHRPRSVRLCSAWTPSMISCMAWPRATPQLLERAAAVLSGARLAGVPVR